MAINKLTQDDLLQPGVLIALLTKINAAIDTLNNATGGASPGPLTGSTLTTSDNVTCNAALPGLTNNAQQVAATLTATASTVGGCEAIFATSQGTYDCTAGNLSHIALRSSAASTKSAGANTLTQTAVRGDAAGADVNVGVIGGATGAATTNTGGQFSAAGGTTNIALNASVGGDVKLGSATEKVGFFNSAGTTKPTVTGSKGANAALASLLTALANMGLLTDSSS